MGMN